MIDYWFLLKCFLVGISASSTVGPMFILTFNNSALHGFLKGFLTALGSALGDSLLVFLGFMGTLSLLQTSQKYHVFIDFAGGLLLVIFGLFMFFQKAPSEMPKQPNIKGNWLLLYSVKSFLLTVMNPLTIFFFMFVSSQLVPTEALVLSTTHLLMGSACTMLGSLSILGSVAFAASSLGYVVSPKRLRIVTIVTGIIIISIGSYFFVDAFRVLSRMF